MLTLQEQALFFMTRAGPPPVPHRGRVLGIQPGTLPWAALLGPWVQPRWQGTHRARAEQSLLEAL